MRSSVRGSLLNLQESSSELLSSSFDIITLEFIDRKEKQLLVEWERALRS